jgi:hypothetical protein
MMHWLFVELFLFFTYILRPCPQIQAIIEILDRLWDKIKEMTHGTKEISSIPYLEEGYLNKFKKEPHQPPSLYLR